ncbi:SPOR domain-containing protein [Pseudogemmobacter bohemicus]|uniref:SPOR domain-containing protein n=1 Tax=Pseudogemmobacter bohemicus TaxID=2250708 RepID=UPI000DD3ACF8|nr:SPOR domain-containing protein [Pseudogemmobacter bohemicus]
MSGKILSVAAFAAVCFAATAYADLRGPAEMPPAGFKGQQYVDSRGCVFLRAGYGGRETWVPRISHDRKQLCGYAPSGRAVVTAEAAPTVADPALAAKAAAGSTPKTTGTKIPSINTKPGAPLPLPAPMQSAFDAAGSAPVAAAPKKTAAAAAVTSSDGYRLTCPATAPVAQKFRVEGGGTRTLCTKGDGTLDGASFPRLQTGGSDSWTGTATAVATGKSVTVTTRKGGSTAIPTPPPGYKLAWEDDRLNPRRGLQTQQGVADQDRLWTRTTPAELHEGGSREVMVRVRRSDGSTSMEPGILVTAADGSQSVKLRSDSGVSKSSKSTAKAVEAAPVIAAESKAGDNKAAGRLFVQVGTFGVAANAEGTAGRLQGLGLPVSRSTLKGGALQVVYAGPFASVGEAQAALSKVRSAGFGDAVMVQ